MEKTTKKGFTVTPQNIDRVIGNMRRELKKTERQKLLYSYCFTPYGTIRFAGKRISGNKRSVNWFKKTLLREIAGK